MSNRTVNDYANEQELQQALSSDTTTAAANPNEPLDLEETAHWDWTIENASSSYEPQSIDQEVQRLLVLKSYFALENQDMTEASRSTFQGLSQVAQQACNSACGLITLVDLARQWFLADSSSQGGGETPRKNGFCAHAILSPDATFVVRDASQDPRFQHHELVTDHGLRFYAGVPLIVPEGYKIGALCVTDSQPRPQGLTALEEAQLHSLAQLVVQTLVSHKTYCDQKKQLQRATRASAMAAHRLVTPLTGAQLALDMLQQDVDLQAKMTPAQKDCLATAQSCTKEVRASCQALRHPTKGSAEEQDVTASTADSSTEEHDCTLHKEEEQSEEEDNSSATLDLTKVIQRLQTALANSSLPVPVILSQDPSLQESSPQGTNNVRTTEAEVFRAALCLVTHATTRTARGAVQLHFRKTTDDLLVVECTDAGPEPTAQEMDRIQGKCTDATDVVQPVCDLQMVAQHIRHSMGGSGGIRSNETSSKHTFFFEIPLSKGTPMKQEDVPTAAPTNLTLQRSFSAPEGRIGQTNSKKKRRALVIDDCRIIRKMVANALSRLDFCVDTACHGAEGVQCLMEQDYDICFCDFLMPVMDGMDCIRALRAWEEKQCGARRRQFVVGMSAHASAQDVERALQLGMDTYRDKPLTFGDLKALTEQLVALEEEEVPVGSPSRTLREEHQPVLPSLLDTARDSILVG